MTRDFSLEPSWLPPSFGPPHIAATAANLTIRVGHHIATRNEDDWSKSVDNSARVALYPLAAWFAASWWRLRWESEPRRYALSPEWRMAHEFAAAGHGFLWPNLTIASDSESIQIVARPTPPLSSEPVRFLSSFNESIPAATFEQAVDAFLNLVLARLRNCGHVNTELEQLWNEVCQERSDPALSSRRRWEAILGFDPMDAPPALLDRIADLAAQIGEEATQELAAACAGPDPAAALSSIEQLAAQPGITAAQTVADQLRRQATAFSAASLPWERGRSLAHAVRAAAGFNGQPLDDRAIASLLGIAEADLQPSWSGAPAPALGLAVRKPGKGLHLHFRKRNRPGIRFEAARLLCDEIIAPPGDKWLPATDSATNRQKTQRAFAAELLCPIAHLDAFLAGDYSQASIEDAADHFGLSPLAVSSHLANNGRVAQWDRAV